MELKRSYVAQEGAQPVTNCGQATLKGYEWMRLYGELWVRIAPQKVFHGHAHHSVRRKFVTLQYDVPEKYTVCKTGYDGEVRVEIVE